ncbi:MAG TPA: hypothetical protein VHE36_08995 [Sphingomicrobium sp.]|nr:hypothetical protein [Sphingomicrobium sp.]
MTILLSQLFSRSTLIASTFFSPRAEPSCGAKLVHARLTAPIDAPKGLTLAATNRLLDTIFGLQPTKEERPYAL